MFTNAKIYDNIITESEVKMSTRANYIFTKDNKEIITFYIHYDGYPEGAAAYFQKALLLGDGRIDSPDIFLRANEDCSITTMLHGDIEYLYKFNIDTQEITTCLVGHKKGRQIIINKSTRLIYDFINTHFKVFSSDETLLEYNRKFSWRSESENTQRVKSENQWFTIPVRNQFDNMINKPRCLALVYKDLTYITQAIINNTIVYSLNNPNYINLINTQQDLMKQLEMLINRIKEN